MHFLVYQFKHLKAICTDSLKTRIKDYTLNQFTWLVYGGNLLLEIEIHSPRAYRLIWMISDFEITTQSNGSGAAHYHFPLSMTINMMKHRRLRGHSTESKTAERPLKDHETCLIFQWSFNELSMISEVFHDSWLIFQWSSWSPWSPKLFETVQNSLSAVFQENGLSVVFQQSFSGLSMNFQRSY